MSDDLNTEIKIGADATGVEAGVGKAKRSLKSLSDAAQQAGKDAGAGMAAVGAGGDKSAKDVERATRTMQNSIQRLIAEQKAGAKGSREYWEALANTRGVNTAALRPLLDQLDAAKSATNAAKGAAESWRDSLGKIGPMVAAAFSGAALAGFIGKVVSVQREFDVLNSSLKTVTGSSAAAEREMAWLKDFAKETPFGLAQATQGFVKMKALGLDPTRAALTSFGNTASAMGKDLNQMIEAVADASTGEFERLKEFGIKAKKEGDQVSLTFQGVTTTIGNSAREITKYLEDIGNTSFGGAMEERAKTLDGTIAALGDTWDELFRTVSTNNVGGLIFDSVTLANGALEDATTILRAMGGAAQDAGRDTGALSTIQNGIATVFETVAVLGANLKYVLVQIGNEIGGLAAQVAQAAQFNFSGVAAIRQAMVADAEAARKEIDATTARILNARKAQEEYARYATRNASAATDPRRVDLGGSTTRKPVAGVDSKGINAANKELADQAKLIAELNGLTGSFAKEWDTLSAVYKKGEMSLEQLTSAQAALLSKQPAIKAFADEQNKAQQSLAKANLDAAQAREKYITSLSTGLDKIQADIAAQIEATERMGLSKEAIAELDAAKLEMLATDLELQAIKAMDRNLDQQTYDALKKQAAAYRELGIAKKGGAAKEAALDMEKANAEAAKKAQEDWERASEQINSTLTDALMRGFESGKDFAKNLRDTVVNMFKTMILRPVISAVLSPVSMALSGLTGAGSAAAGQAGGSALGSAGGSLMGSALGGIGAFGTGASYGATSLFANGLTGTLAAGGQMLGAGSVMSGLGTIAGALGPIAIGIALLSSLIKKSTPHMGAASSYSEAGGLVSNADIYQSVGFRDARTYNAEAASVTGGVAKAIGDALDSTARAFGKTAGYEITTAFADDKSKDGAWGSLIIKQMGDAVIDWRDTQTSKWAPKEFADGEAGSKEYLAEVAKSARDALVQAIGDVGWANDMLTALGESPTLEGLAVTVQQINAAQAAFESLGKNIVGFGALTDGAISQLVKAAGSIDGLVSAASTYYDNFYTEAEKAANVTRDVASALADVGLQMPATREDFRALVESQMALGDAGMDAVAALLKVSGAFASVTAESETAADAAARLADEQGKAAEAAARAAEKAAEDAARAYEKTLAYLTKTAETAMQILGAAVDREKQTQNAGYEAQIAIIDAQRKAANTAMDAQRVWMGVAIGGAQNYAKAMESEAARIRGFFTGMVLQDDPDAPAGASTFAAQAALRAGDKSDAVLRKATDIDPEMFASWADYAVNFFETQGLVRGATQDAERAASMAYSDVALLEQQLTLAEDKYKADLEHYTRLEGIAKETLDSNLLRLDALVQSAQDQLAEATGTKLAVMTIAQAMGNFSSAAGKLAWFTGNAITTPLPTAPVLTPFGAQTPETTIAPVAYSPVAYGGSGAASSNDRVVAALQDVLAELQAMRATGADTKAAVEKTSAILDQVTAGGNAMLTETA